VETQSDAVRPSTLPAALEILIRPRETMRRILDAGRYRWMPQVLVTVLLASLTEPKNRAIFSEKGAAAISQHGLVIAGSILAGCAFVLLIFYGLSWIAWWAGRFFEGSGTPKEVRAAMAWGLMPVIILNVLKLPLVFVMPVTTESLDPMTCSLAAISAGFALAMLIYYLIVGSLTLAEGHRTTAFGGAAVLILTLISPFVLVVAGLLAFK
jgi:hypothetical protein